MQYLSYLYCRAKQACEGKSYISRLVGTTTFSITLEGATVKELTKGLKVGSHVPNKPAKARAPPSRTVHWNSDGEFFSKVNTTPLLALMLQQCIDALQHAHSSAVAPVS